MLRVARRGCWSEVVTLSWRSRHRTMKREALLRADGGNCRLGRGRHDKITTARKSVETPKAGQNKVVNRNRIIDCQRIAWKQFGDYEETQQQYSVPRNADKVEAEGQSKEKRSKGLGGSVNEGRAIHATGARRWNRKRVKGPRAVTSQGQKPIKSAPHSSPGRAWSFLPHLPGVKPAPRLTQAFCPAFLSGQNCLSIHPAIADGAQHHTQIVESVPPQFQSIFSPVSPNRQTVLPPSRSAPSSSPAKRLSAPPSVDPAAQHHLLVQPAHHGRPRRPKVHPRRGV